MIGEVSHLLPEEIDLLVYA